MDEDLGTKSLEDQNFTRDLITGDESLAKYDPKLRSIAKKLLHPDPIRRLSVEELLKKKFVRQWQNKINHMSK